MRATLRLVTRPLFERSISEPHRAVRRSFRCHLGTCTPDQAGSRQVTPEDADSARQSYLAAFRETCRMTNGDEHPLIYAIRRPLRARATWILMGVRSVRIKRTLFFLLGLVLAWVLFAFVITDDRLALEYVRALSWPTVIAVTLYWLRAPLRQKFRQLLSVEAWGASAQFSPDQLNDQLNKDLKEPIAELLGDESDNHAGSGSEPSRTGQEADLPEGSDGKLDQDETLTAEMTNGTNFSYKFAYENCLTLV